MFNTILYLSLAALAAAQDASNSTGLVGALQSNEDLSSLAGAIALVPGLADTLAGSSNITILAPINSAFAAVPSDSAVGQAIANRDVDTVAALLSYHVVQGTYASTDFADTPAFAKTLLNNTAFTNVTGGQNLGLVRQGDAFNIISGDDATSNVTQADIRVGDITIHKIGSVLTLPSNVSPTLASQYLSAAADAIGSTDLGPTLNTADDLTIFIPNNAAFQAIASTLANASAEAVSSILTYHAITGTVAFSSDLTNTTIKTVDGASVRVTVGGDGAVFVDAARVVKPNIILSNGVLHVIDSVLSPETNANGGSPATPTQPAATTSSYSGAAMPQMTGNLVALGAGVLAAGLLL